VIGLKRSVREWAMRQGWGGRLVRQEQAQGILVAALGVLAAHSRDGEDKLPSCDPARPVLDIRAEIGNGDDDRGS
jgi:hypothetical protein